jgi:hypothetical protein
MPEELFVDTDKILQQRREECVRLYQVKQGLLARGKRRRSEA